MVSYAKDRMDICEACEYYKASVWTCQQCGCFMPAKSRIPTASCPIGKWKSIYEGTDIKSAFGRGPKV